MKARREPQFVEADPSAASRRERQTLIPTFDPDALTSHAGDEAERDGMPTAPPPFDPTSYARIVDRHVTDAFVTEPPPRRDTPATLILDMTSDESDESDENALSATDVDTLGRAMYGSYLESDFPEALVLAEQVLERQPDHALAQVVAERCRAVLAPPPSVRLSPSAVVRLRSSRAELEELVLDTESEIVLCHVDGVADAERIAKLSGMPRHEALDRLHALLDLGVLEVLSA